MQTLCTIEDKETGGVQTLLHVSSQTGSGLVVFIYVSDEYGTYKTTIRKKFVDACDSVYHRNLRKKIKKEGGIIHARISDTPLAKTNKSTNRPKKK